MYHGYYEVVCCCYWNSNLQSFSFHISPANSSSSLSMRLNQHWSVFSAKENKHLPSTIECDQAKTVRAEYYWSACQDVSVLWNWCYNWAWYWALVHELLSCDHTHNISNHVQMTSYVLPCSLMTRSEKSNEHVSSKSWSSCTNPLVPFLVFAFHKSLKISWYDQRSCVIFKLIRPDRSSWTS